MTRREAIAIFARIAAHFPSLGGGETDPAARVRAEDWCRVIERTSADVGAEACVQLIEAHSMPPRIADWQETVRVIAARRQLEQRPALESGERTADPEKVHAELAKAHAVIANPERPVTTIPPKAPPRHPRFDPITASAEYGRVYDEAGHPQPELEQEVNAWKKGRWAI